MNPFDEDGHCPHCGDYICDGCGDCSECGNCNCEQCSECGECLECHGSYEVPGRCEDCAGE